MELLDRLKIRLEISDDSTDGILNELLISARSLFLSVRYPFSQYPVNEDDEPVIEKRWDDWILRVAIELYSKMGAEGQTGHLENGINRTFESGTISKSLRAEVMPIVGISR